MSAFGTATVVTVAVAVVTVAVAVVEKAEDILPASVVAALLLNPTERFSR